MRTWKSFWDIAFQTFRRFWNESDFWFERNMNERIYVRNQYLWHMVFMLR